MLAEWNRTSVFAFQNISCVSQSAVISISHTEAFRWLAYPAKVGLACITIDTDVDSITHGQRFSSHHRYVLFFTLLSLVNTGTWYWCYIHAFTPSNHGLHSETPIIVFSCLEHLKGSPVRPITGTYEEYIVSTSVTIRSCTIFLRNQPSAPQKVDVRLAAHPCSPPAPFLAVRPPKCADPIRRRPQERMGSVFAAGEKKLKAFFCDCFDNFMLNFFVAFFFEGAKFKRMTFFCPRMKQGFQGSQKWRNRWFQWFKW